MYNHRCSSFKTLTAMPYEVDIVPQPLPVSASSALPLKHFFSLQSSLLSSYTFFPGNCRKSHYEVAAPPTPYSSLRHAHPQAAAPPTPYRSLPPPPGSRSESAPLEYPHLSIFRYKVSHIDAVSYCKSLLYQI